MVERGFSQLAQVELDGRFVHIEKVGLEGLKLVPRELGLEAPVRHGGCHGIRDMPNATQAGSLQRQRSRRNIHAHATDHDGHIVTLTELQAEVVQALHS